MNIEEIKQKVYHKLCNLNSVKDVYELFSVLNYSQKVILDINAKRKKDWFGFNDKDAKRIKEIYSVLSFGIKLSVFLIEANSLSNTFIKSVTSKFSSQYNQCMLIFTQNYKQYYFIIPEKEKIDVGIYELKINTLSIDVEEIKKKNEECIEVQIISNLYYSQEANERDIWNKWKNAFSVKQ